ncbi:hypothetical protein IMZ08_05465 [Bacillus luteolus]|uniref:Uncharacterized protein n=1 Tax=Litchfieldia luteola TaxID=682179 RepID=A0ABR9QG89_9BACI|nr:hypothetical protein [Cytobacillus luteolus]MBE4907511.1 hypothetical protein [Cytobacillus luteolus]MBP1944279.1 vacuolar-type H+-ATPase subunit H [Cytobacillus luteolus]
MSNLQKRYDELQDELGQLLGMSEPTEESRKRANDILDELEELTKDMMNEMMEKVKEEREKISKDL